MQAIDLLDLNESVELLHAKISPHMDVERPTLERLAVPCKGLPIAMRIVAGRALTENSAAHVADELENENTQYDLVKTFPNGDVDLNALFSWSYRALPADTQRMFRLLGLHPAPGTSTDAYAAAVLVNTDINVAKDLLNDLLGQSLLDRNDRRFSMHDLVRAYALELIDLPDHEDERRTALERLTTAYYGSVNHAFDSLNRANPMVDSEFLAVWRERDPVGVAVVNGFRTGHEWFALERPNVLAAVRNAAATSPAISLTARLACSMFYLLEVGGHLEDWAEMESVAEQAVSASENRRDQAASLRNRGRLALVHVLGDYQERLRDDHEKLDEQANACHTAILLLKQAHQLYAAESAEHGAAWAQAGQATVVRELADAHRLMMAAAPSRVGADTTIAIYQEAELIYLQLGSANGLASLRQALGQAHFLNKQYDEAEECYRDSLAFAQAFNQFGKPQHPRLKAFTLCRLGDLYQHQRRYDDATDYYSRCAVAFSDDLDDPISRARTLAKRGRSYAALGNTSAALQDFDDARTIIAARRPLKDEDPEVKVISSWRDSLS